MVGISCAWSLDMSIDSRRLKNLSFNVPRRYIKLLDLNYVSESVRLYLKSNDWFMLSGMSSFGVDIN